MTEGQDDKTPEGGSEWELGEAIKLMGAAQASGDPEQIATAMRRHAEALTNATNTIMIPTLRSVLESVVRTEVGKLTSRIENSDSARLTWNTQFQSQLNSRLDGHALVLDEDVKRLAASVEGAAALAGKAFRLAEEVQAGVGELAERVNHMGERVDSQSDTLSQHAAAIQETRSEVEILRSEMRSKFQLLEQKLAALAARQTLFDKVLAANPSPIKKPPDAD